MYAFFFSFFLVVEFMKGLDIYTCMFMPYSKKVFRTRKIILKIDPNPYKTLKKNCLLVRRFSKFSRGSATRSVYILFKNLCAQCACL